MATDLFAVASGLAPAALAEVVPPACLRTIAPPPPARDRGTHAVLEFPEWRPRTPARHLLPSLSVLTPREVTFRFDVSVLAGGAWTAWIGAAALGPRRLPPVAGRDAGVEADIDVFIAGVPADAVRLRLVLASEDAVVLEQAPWLVALSASDQVPAPPPAADGAVSLVVPAFSQMDAPEPIRLRVCSPTSVAMVLGYLGVEAGREAVAADMFHAETDRYGVWPAAICAAARRGSLGYLLRFPDWPSAAWCLGHGLPIIASIRYAAGELSGAPIPQTSGHLVVVTGYDGRHVLVNDPAAPDRASVPRRYPLPEFARAWLDHAGVGYILFRPR